MWQIKIQSANFQVPPTALQETQISFRKAGTSDAFSSPVTVKFNADGTINGSPNPYIINNISDAWAGVEVKTVNTCNAEEVLQTFNKP